MKVLVTGGAGFVGRRVVAGLRAVGAEVRILDLVAAPGADGVEVVVGDVTDPDVVTRAVEDVDAVCHQAARVGLGVDFGDAGGYVHANDVGTAVLLEALWRRRFAGRFVLAGSMVIYGDGRSRCAVHGDVAPAPRRAVDLDAGRFDPRCPETGCGREVGWAEVGEDAPVDPRNVYAATKLHQEHLCQAWAREADATLVTLRYHNVYGPGMPRGTPYAGVAAIFRSALEAGEAPLVFEDGDQTRDFVHVDDVAHANVLSLTRADVAAGAYNVASGSPRTVGDVAWALWTALGASAPEPVVTGRWRAGDVRHVVASPRKAAEVLGFTARVPFEDGMAALALEPRSA